MIVELLVENPKEVLKSLKGKHLDLENGNLKLGSTENLRMEKGKLICDAVIADMKLFENYGSKAFVAGFPVKVRS